MENDEDEVLPDAPASSSPEPGQAKGEPEEEVTKPAAEQTSGQVQLADLFDDDDDDEEFPGSSAVEGKLPSSPPGQAL